MRRSGTTAAIGTALATAATAVAATPTGGSWSGTTSQKDSNGVPGTIAFKVSKNHKAMKHFKWQEMTKCDSGQTFTSINTTQSLKITKRGHVDVVGTFMGSAGNGYTAQHAPTLHGRFTSKHAFKATLEDIILIFDSSGKQVDTCRTGTVKLHAKHR